MALDPLTLLEALAVVLALAYLLLAARESLWCWYCAFASSALYTVVFWDVSLLMEVALNLFYVVMAVVGWYQWRQGGERNTPRIVSLPWHRHLWLLGLMLVLALVNGWMMRTYTSAAWPFLDAFIAWGSVINTVLVVRKILENWLYWLLLDGLALGLYVERGLYLTALLFALYLVIVAFGYLRWHREYHAYSSSAG